MPIGRIRYSPLNLGRWSVWSGFALALAIAPLVFSSGSSVSLLSLMGTMMIFSLSYNMLLGQSGMLSFGHAVYSGLGAFFAIHAINLASSGDLPMPLTLVPLVGGVAGLLFGVLFGYVTTQRSGTAFSMISLGIVELVFACSLMFPGFFGGEGGVSGNRVFGQSFLGMSFGPQIQVYYLIAFWLFISTAAMFALAHTPLGRIANAVRDNPERAEFVGYDPQRVRFLMLMLSAFFAGISGGLTAINFEIVSAENVSAARSGAVLLFAFIGGTGVFFGPMLGAIVGVLLTVTLPEFTKAWLLYLGIFFIMMVMYAPGGMASLIVMTLRLVSNGLISRVLPAMLRLVVPVALALIGFVMLIEMTYRLSLDAAHGTSLSLLGLRVDAASTPAWLIAIFMLAVGGLFFLRLRGAFLESWEDAQASLEHHATGRRA